MAVDRSLGRAALCLRALVIAAVVAAAAIRVAWPLVVAQHRKDMRARDHLLGCLVVASASRLGPCFVKVAQMFSYRADLLSADLIGPLTALQDDVCYAGRRDDVATCREELALHATGITVDPVPAGSGSVAIVFKGHLPSGAAVALKVVRPWVAASIAMDCALLRCLVRMLARGRAFREVPLVLLFDQVATMVHRQVDMVEEGRVLDQFAKSANVVRGVGVPRRVPDIAAQSRILVMEWVGDYRPLRSAELSDSAFRQASRSLLRRLYNMIFNEGLVHCDLHPGNVLSNEYGALMLVDVGLAVRLSDADRIAFRSFFSAFVWDDASRCTDAIVRSAIQRPDALDMQRLRADVAALLARHHGRLAGEFLVVRFVHEVFELQRRHRLFGAPGFVAAVWALAMYEGLVRDRYPELDFQAEAKPHVVSHLIAMARMPH